jgi:putative NADPH-quinone reductase
MRALVVYCHPRDGSFTAAVRDTVLEKLNAAGADVRLTCLYTRQFQPCLTAEEHEIYEDTSCNQAPIQNDCDDLMWCDTLIFVYPTWWYGLPAILKGWLDRVMVPGVAFTMPRDEGETIGPGLTHIKRLGVFTTCGASFWLTAFVGSPGKRTLMRGVGLLCAKNRRTAFAAHYLMDSSTAESRAKHLVRVSRQMDKLIGRAERRQTAPA